MSDTLIEPASAPERPRSARRRRARRLARPATLVVIVTLTSLLGLRHLDHRYGPIQSGTFGGLYSQRNFVVSKDGSSARLAASPGVGGQLIASMSNAGDHSAKITSIDTDDVVTAIRWSAYQPQPGGNIEGVNMPWRPFPAVVPAHSLIRLLITIHRPADCHAYPPGSDSYSGLHTVHWDSLLHRHSTEIDDGLGSRDIRFC